MKLYVTRHGESESNCLDLVSGRTDVELTQMGIEQGKELGQKLKGIQIDVVITSPLMRARKTAELANEFVGAPILIDDRLLEISFGTFEGASRLAPEFLAIRNSFSRRFPGGESTCMVLQRVYNFMDEIKEIYAGKTVLIVTHNVTSKSINGYCRDLTDEEFHKFRMKNCELITYEID